MESAATNQYSQNPAHPTTKTNSTPFIVTTVPRCREGLDGTIQVQLRG
jgi:hypothetical protein